LERALQVVASVDPAPDIVFQPVTPIAALDDRLKNLENGARVLPPPPARLAAWWEWSRRKVPVVKIIPQMHPIWGLP
jgi:hypothetical protein